MYLVELIRRAEQAESAEGFAFAQWMRCEWPDIATHFARYRDWHHTVRLEWLELQPKANWG